MLWVPRRTWVRLALVQMVAILLVSLALNVGINSLTRGLVAAGIRSVPISRGVALAGIITVEVLAALAIFATVLVFVPGWALARIRQRVFVGACGACGYDLRPSRPDAAGLVLCPECGATWDRARARPTVREWARGT